jgi:hypothetical protein
MDKRLFDVLILQNSFFGFNYEPYSQITGVMRKGGFQISKSGLK